MVDSQTSNGARNPVICNISFVNSNNIFFSALLIFYSTSSLVTERYYMCYQSHQSSPSSQLIELPEVFSSTEKCLLHQALRPGDPLIKLLELRFVSSSSETSRSSGTIQTSQSSISSHPAFPDACWHYTVREGDLS